jgi:drug/metabolite transporter (DMT)-like permease
VPGTSNSPAPSQKAVLAALFAVQALFAVNFITSKLIVHVLPPLLWASVRCLIAGTLLIGFAQWRRPATRPSGFKYFRSIAFLSVLGVVFNQGCFLLGISFTSSTNSAILNTLIPVFTLAIVTLRRQELLTRKNLAGFILSLLGVCFLLRPEKFRFSNRTAVGDLLILVNCFSFALFLSYGKGFFSRNDTLWATGWLFLFGAIGLGMMAVPTYHPINFALVTPSLYGCIAYGILGATLLTYALNNWALAHTKATKVALFIYVQPLLGTVLSVVLLKEQPTLNTLLAAGFIFAGVFVTLTPRKKLPRKTPAPGLIG